MTVDFLAIAEQAWSEASARDPALERRSFMAGLSAGFKVATTLLEMREAGAKLEPPPEA